MENLKDLLDLGYIKDSKGRINTDSVLNPDIKPYGFLLSENKVNDSSIRLYKEVFGDYEKEFIEKCLKENKVYGVAFVVFSYNKGDGVLQTHKHVHPKHKSKDCYTRAYFKQITKDFEDPQFLYWHDNKGEDYSKEIYSSYNLIEDLNFEYEELKVKDGDVLEFCSSNKIHFTNNTRNLGMWVVFDYVIPRQLDKKIIICY